MISTKELADQYVEIKDGELKCSICGKKLLAWRFLDENKGKV